MSNRKDKKLEMIETTEHEVAELTSVLNSWSPIIFIDTIDFPNLMSDMCTAIKRINRDAKLESRTKLLWFNMASGLFEVQIYSNKDTRDDSIKAVAPNGLRLNPVRLSSSAMAGRQVDYNMGQLLKTYSEFNPTETDTTFQSSILLLNHVDREIENNTALRQSLVHFLQHTEVLFTREQVNRQIVVAGAGIRIPAELERANIVYHHKGYTIPKMVESLVQSLDKATEAELNAAQKTATAMAGLTITEAQSVLNLMANRKPKDKKKELSILDLAEDDINFITHRRKEIVNRGGLLEIVDPEIPLEDVGGNEILKEFVDELDYVHKKSFEAMKFGIQKHRGILLLGPPGTGKSTICQAIAHKLRAPYMILDLAKIMESRVGSSEANIEMAMSMAEKIGGVLQIDEIEKKLGGVESSNRVDGGITLRIFDTILKYMARRNDIIFIATANSIKGLPPELTRKGRIDEIFLIDYPCVEEISEIAAIHVRKSGRKLEDILTKQEEVKFVKMLDQYTGSEIEYIVNKALRKSFVDKKQELTFKLFEDIITDTVPMSKTYKTTLNEVREWAVTVASPSSKGSAFAKLRAKKLQEKDEDKS